VPRLLRHRPDPELLDLVEESGRNVQRASLLLRNLLVDYPENAHLAHDLFVCEQEGDRVTHDVIHRLNRPRARFAPRPTRPFDASDGYLLATALDDVVDYAEQTADTLSMYQVEAPMEQAGVMADVLVGASEQVADALRALRTGADLSPFLVEIHRLENEGDRVSREAIASLFANGIDPMVVIRWKDIFESLEAAVDACERVAHVLEGITLKRRARR
jgi:predicted phosphate transport protein (TIGR00153 family)